MDAIITIASAVKDLVLSTMQAGFEAFVELGNSFWYAQGAVLKSGRWKDDNFTSGAGVLKTRDAYYAELRKSKRVADAWELSSVKSYSLTAEQIRIAYPDISLEEFEGAFMNLHKSKGNKMLKELVKAGRSADLKKVLDEAVKCEGSKDFQKEIREIQQDLGLVKVEEADTRSEEEKQSAALSEKLEALRSATILYIEYLSERTCEQIGASQPDAFVVTRFATLVEKLDKEAEASAEFSWSKRGDETPEIGRDEIEELISQNGTPELV